MNSQRTVSFARWASVFGALVAVTAVYDQVLRVNATTVALTYLLFILFFATRWGLRFAIAGSVFATTCYNFFFLPPVHTFTVSDPQNLVALLVLLITSVVSSRMSEKVREEGQQTRARQTELEVLYALSRALLQTDEIGLLTTTIPVAVAEGCRATSVVFYQLQGDKSYRHGEPWPEPLGAVELRVLSQAATVSLDIERKQATIPLRTGVRPRGVLLVHGIEASLATLEAMGGLVSIALDRAQAVEQAMRAEAARESERLRAIMMDSITHEFRSPLTALKVSVSTLRTTPLSETASSELLTVIEEETDHLDRLVAQSVEMARLDTLKVSMKLSPQRLGDLVERALHSGLRRSVTHPLTVAIGETLPLILADPEWLPKLIANLVENAAKYSRAGEPIVITATQRGEMLACSVADHGVGIDPLEQELIFDRFYRSRDRSAHVSGTGMGLAICRAIADAHGGTLEVASGPGRGSVFTFVIPTVREATKA